MPSNLFALKQIPQSQDIRKFYENSDGKIGTFFDFIENLSTELERANLDATPLHTSDLFSQVIFPIKNSELSEEDYNYLNLSLEFKEHLLMSLALMMQFYGFELSENDKGVKTINYVDEEKRKSDREWKKAGSLHHARLARIINSLNEFGLSEQANALRDFLQREKILSKEEVAKSIVEAAPIKTARQIEIEEDEKAGRITRFLLLQAMQNKENLTVEDRVKLRNRLMELAKSNDWGNQEDASEMFITPLFDHIFKQNHPIQFRIKTNSVDGQNIYSERVENLNKIELPIEGEAPVSTYMVRAEAAQDLNGANQYKLEVEGQPARMVDAKRSEKYVSAENDVFIALKRFSYTAQGQAVKLEDKVELDDLNLNSGQEKDYEARAFIIHTGAHYVACVKDREGWWLYDDKKVEQIPEDKINEYKQKAYIVKYSKKSSPLPVHQKFGTTNFDGLNNACWANASLSLVLSSDNIENMLTQEFANQNVNFDADLAAIDARIQEKAEQRQIMLQIQQHEAMERHAQEERMYQREGSQIRPSLFFGEKRTEELNYSIEADLLWLVPTLEDAVRMYTAKGAEEIKPQLSGGGKAIFSNFEEFAHDFLQQLNQELESKNQNNQNLIYANNSFLHIIFPVAYDLAAMETLKALGKTEGVQEKFDHLYNEMLGFYGLVKIEHEGKISVILNIDEEKLDWQQENNHNHDRFTMMILSAISLGYYEHAKGLYEFFQREVDKKQSMIISPQIRDYWSDQVFNLLSISGVQIKRIKNSQELSDSSKAKRAKKEENFKTQKDKIETKFVTNDVYDFPTIESREILKNKELTVGDLHGNALKLLWILVHHDVIEMSQSDYERFAQIYCEDLDQLPDEDYTEFNEIVARIKVNKENGVFLRLIGDTLCDRGKSDYFTTILLGHLNDQGLESEILFSNHDDAFIKSLHTFLDLYQDEIKAGVKNQRENFANCLNNVYDFSGTALGNMGQSMTNLEQALLLGRIGEKNFEKFYNIINKQYLGQLKLVSYNLDKDGGITLFNHAPCGLDVIEAAAKKLGVEYKNATARELADSIDRINIEFQKYIKGEVKDGNGEIISIFNLEEKGDPTIENSNLINCEKNPFSFLILSRLSTTNSVYEDVNLPYKVRYTFGHDQRGSLTPKGLLFAEENTQIYQENLCNLDNDFCIDMSYQGNYNYRIDENPRVKARIPHSMAIPRVTQNMQEQTQYEDGRVG